MSKPGDGAWEWVVAVTCLSVTLGNYTMSLYNVIMCDCQSHIMTITPACMQQNTPLHLTITKNIYNNNELCCYYDN